MIDEINDLFDVVASEKAEKSIDLFIEKRSKEAEKANREQKMLEEWDRRARARQLKRQKENRESWIEFHGRRHRVFLDLAGHHADRRSRLMAEAGYEPEETPGPEAAPPTAEGLLESIATEGGGGNA